MTAKTTLAALACFFVGASLITACATHQPEPKAGKPIKALLLTGGGYHNYPKQREILEAGLKARLNITIDHLYDDTNSTTPPLPFFGKPDYAKGYDVVIHDECAADISDPAILDAVLAPHRAGTPGVNLHCAMHSYRSGTWKQAALDGAVNAKWFEYLGLQSTGHGPQKPITLTLANPASALTKGLTAWTTPPEELYNNVHLYDIQPLLRGAQAADGSDSVVIAWTHEYGPNKARVFGTTLAHNETTMADPRYLDLVARGVEWATGRLP